MRPLHICAPWLRQVVLMENARDIHGGALPRVRSRKLVAAQAIAKGEYVTEYGGHILTHAAALELKEKFPERAHWLLSLGMLDLKINGCMADIAERARTDCLAAMANHDAISPNCTMEKPMVCSTETDSSPAAFLRAMQDIVEDDEITWDYGSSAAVHHDVGSIAAHGGQGTGMQCSG